MEKPQLKKYHSFLGWAKNFSTHSHKCGAFNKFPYFFVQAFRIVVDS